jgi:hypothetical protein
MSTNLSFVAIGFCHGHALSSKFRRRVALMNFILYAVPFFFVLIAVELLADRWRKVDNYRVADAINSLSTGVLSTTTGLLTKGVGLVSYAFALEHFALWRLSAESVWVWVFAFIFYDFCYYWLHRLGHERNILWAAHSVHHQSEDYNLSTALRQTSTGFSAQLDLLPAAGADRRAAGGIRRRGIAQSSVSVLGAYPAHSQAWLVRVVLRHAVESSRAPCAEPCLHGSQLRRGVHCLGPAVRDVPGRAGQRAAHIRRHNPLEKLEPALGQRAVLRTTGGRCAASRLLVGQAADLVHAHRLAACGCSGAIPDQQTGPESVP